MATSRSAAVKRLMKELAELRQEPSPEFTAAPLDENLFEWHFTLRGPPEGGFEGGRFHGRLIFPPDYPFKPPTISFLTPNGRFEVGKKICLSITDHHPEYWRPAWGVRTALVALISFLPTPGDGAIGALDYSVEERRRYAAQSRAWVCAAPGCGRRNADALPDETEAPSERLTPDREIAFTIKAESTRTNAQRGGAGAGGPASENATERGTPAGANDSTQDSPSPAVIPPPAATITEPSLVAPPADPVPCTPLPPTAAAIATREPGNGGTSSSSAVSSPPHPQSSPPTQTSSSSTPPISISPQPLPGAQPPSAHAAQQPQPQQNHQPAARVAPPAAPAPRPDALRQLRRVEAALVAVALLLAILLMRHMADGGMASRHAGRPAGGHYGYMDDDD
ncbi:ubiquitin-conjugating enzyme/RWD-like protein [Powellomyces hirtus]|nr:ubiquitin-conjugating enzyme/RWD-like protein [Powellomyces hirtus]